MDIKINKGINTEIRFKIYKSYIPRIPINLEDYIELICAITDEGRLLIEKRLSTNSISVKSERDNARPNIMIVEFEAEDTRRLKINPSNEEKLRTLEIFGIKKDRTIVRFEVYGFYLEGSGYYPSYKENKWV